MSTTSAVRAPHVRFYDVESDDGTVVRAWTNDAEGPTVLLCNGLGTSAYTWPALLQPDCGVHVVSWNHRGVGGSERPADRRRVGIDAFLEDALAVARHGDLGPCVVAGWSMGVNLAFEMAVRWPEQVTGIFALAGVPGDTFSTMLRPFRIPGPVAKQVTVRSAQLLGMGGKAITPLTRHLPSVPFFVDLVRHSGIVLPAASSEEVRVALKEFVTTDVDWYMNLAVHASRHPRVSLSKIHVPTTLVAGRRDLLAGSHAMRTAADRIEDARYVELGGTHFLSLEQPAAVHGELLDLVARAATP